MGATENFDALRPFTVMRRWRSRPCKDYSKTGPWLEVVYVRLAWLQTVWLSLVAKVLCLLVVRAIWRIVRCTRRKVTVAS